MLLSLQAYLQAVTIMAIQQSVRTKMYSSERDNYIVMAELFNTVTVINGKGNGKFGDCSIVIQM